MWGWLAGAAAALNPVAAIGTLAGGAGKLIGAKMESDAAKDAAGIQSAAADRATQLQERMYNQSRADNEPWRQAGLGALSKMGDADYMRDFTAADFQQDPGYAFRMQEGQKALERSAAARGGLQSGGTLKALSRYGQDFASNEYQNAYTRFNADRDRRFGRLSNLAGMGQTATGQNAAYGQNYANQASENITGAANAQAAGKIGSANAWGGALSSIGQMGMDMGAMAATGGAGGNWMGRTKSALSGNVVGTPIAGSSYRNPYNIA
jgi:hypothetical protein